MTTTTNATNIVLVHGSWADGSSWSKVIPILKNAGHRIIAVELTLHSMADNIATVKRAIDLSWGTNNSRRRFIWWKCGLKCCLL